MQKEIRIILDTNWWVGFVISKSSYGLPGFLRREDIIICFSEELNAEIHTTLSYARTIKRINETNLQLFQLLLEDAVTFYNVVSEIHICRDINDNYLLALAKDANADFLITNDEDLLVLNPFENTCILKLHDFLTILSTHP